MPADTSFPLAIMARLACAGILIQTLEVVWNGRELRDGRLLGWRERTGSGGARRLPDMLGSFPWCAWLLGLRLIFAALGLVVAVGGGMAFGVFSALVVLQLYYNWRFTMIAGNCETMFLVCLVAVQAGGIPGASPELQRVALVFVAAQAAIAYGVAGTNKLVSRGWRNGSRLLQIMRDGSYQIPGGTKYLETRPAVTRLAAWAVIALELLLPVAIFLPTPVCVFFLAGGIFFHTMIAITMGLHGFWWSFAAAYPSLWFVHVWVGGYRG